MQDQQDPPPTPGEIAHACHHQPGPRRGSWCLLELCLCRDSICSLQAAVCSAQTLQLDPKASRRTLTAASVPHLPGRRNLLALTGAGPRIASPFAVSESLLLCSSRSHFSAGIEQLWLEGPVVAGEARCLELKGRQGLYGLLGLLGFIGVYLWLF